MIASATSAVTSVHAGTPGLSGRTETEAFPAAKISSGCSGNSTEEEDALMEREEERLMLEDEAEQHMLSVALANSVDNVKENEAAEIRSKEQVSSDGTRGQLTGDSTGTGPKSNGERSLDGRFLSKNGKGQTSRPQCGDTSNGPIEGLKEHTNGPINAPSAGPTAVSSPKSPRQRRTRNSLDEGSISEEGKGRGSIYLGTRKRRRELAQDTVSADTGPTDLSKERHLSCAADNGHVSNPANPIKIDGNSNANPNCISSTYPSTQERRGQAHGSKSSVAVKLESPAVKLESNTMPVSLQRVRSVNNPVASPTSVMPAPKGKASNPSPCNSSGAVPDPIHSSTRVASTDTKQAPPTSQASTYAPAPVLSTPGPAVASSQPSCTDNDFALQPPAVPPRQRIFSVDLDPAGFDFDSSICVTWSSTTGNSENLPPLVPLSQPNAGTFASASTQVNLANESPAVHPGSAAAGRDRAMSFELFSLGVNVEEPLLPVPSIAGWVDALSGTGAGRPRGDSIIFDPISFSDGGIHEESALQRIRNTSISMEDTDELEIMNSPGFVEAPASYLNQPHSFRQLPPPAPPLTANSPFSSKLPVPSPLLRTTTPVPSPLAQIPSNTLSHSASIPTPVPSSYPPKRKSGNHYVVPKRPFVVQQKEVQRQTRKKVSPLIPVGSSVSGANVPARSTCTSVPPSNDKVINMPHGSAAAAAAAMAVPSTVVPSSLNGTATSHTACPMELLNKGGRIGIYLPDARKARIAKFHSKRKMRIWRKRIKYDCRKKLADSRPRIKGRFVKRSDMDDDE